MSHLRALSHPILVGRKRTHIHHCLKGVGGVDPGGVANLS